MKKIILIISFINLLISHGYSAKLTFNDGTILEGKIKEITEDKIILEYEFGEVQRFRNQITSITNLTSAEEQMLTDADLKGLKSGTGSQSSGINPLSNSGPAESLITTNQSDNSDRIVNKSSVDKPAVATNGKSNELEQSAYNSLLLLKNKIQANFEKEKANLLQTFAAEKAFLEENLETLAKKHSALQEQFDSLQKEKSSLNIKLDEQKNLIAKYEQDIVNIKNELSYINEARLKAEVAQTEKLQEAIMHNKKLLDSEKQTLIASYENQIQELEKQLREANIKILELGKQNSELSSKLANSEKLSNQNEVSLSSLEKQFDNYKIEIQKTMAELKEKNKSDREALEQMFSKSGESLAALNNELKMIKEENLYLKEENDALRKEIEEKTREIETVEKEKARFKQDAINALQKQRVLKEESKQEQETLLKSIVQSVMSEEKVEDMSGLEEEARKALLEAKDSGKLESQIGKSALIKLFQDDMSRLSDQLKNKENELNRLKKDNTSLNANIKKIEFQLTEIEREKKEAEERAARFEKEKQDLKSEVENIIRQIKEESKLNIQKEKEELRKQFEQAMDTMTSKGIKENQPEDQPKTSEGNPSSQPEPEYLNEEINTDKAENENITGNTAKKEEQVQETSETAKERQDETIPPQLETSPLSQKTGENGKIEVGLVSQIEPEFNRIFIDTKEIVKEGDVVYIISDNNDIPFKIIKVYQALNGAIAEITDPDQIKNIKLNDSVYVK